MICSAGSALMRAWVAGPTNGCVTGRIARRDSTATDCEPSVRLICSALASMAPPLMIWPVPSTTLAMQCGLTGLIPICHRRRTTLDWKTRAIGPAWISTGLTTGSIGWGRGEWPRIRTRYVKAARDLYTAARRDLEAGRDERAGELARAAEAMTHVPEHLAQIGDGFGAPLPRPAPRTAEGRPRSQEKGLRPTSAWSGAAAGVATGLSAMPFR